MTPSQRTIVRLLGAAIIALALLAAGASAVFATGPITAATTVPTVNLTSTPAVSPTATVVPIATGGALNVVRTPGATVFLGERGLDITATGVAAGTTLGWFQAGADIGTSSPDDTLIVSNPADFYVQPGTRTGVWYDLDRDRAVAINVRDPSLAVRTWAVENSQDVSGRTVTRGRLLGFRVDSNLDAVYTQRGAGAPVTVKVQGPDGAVYAALIDDLGTQNAIANVPVTSSSFLVPGRGTNGTVWDTANPTYGAGDYRVWAESNLNGMKDNYKDPSGADYTGKTITARHTVSLGRDQLSITASTNDTVVRNNDFAVVVTGEAATAYALWLSGTSSISSPDEAPRIKVGQAGVTPGDAAVGALVFSGARTVASDVPAVPAGATASPYYARVVTDDSGRRTVGFMTSQQTRDQSYTVRVQRLDAAATSRYDTVGVEVAEGRLTLAAPADQSFYLGEEVVLSGTNTDSATTYLYVTGPNLPSGGARLTDMTGVVSGDAGTFTSATVADDDTWEYRWATANLNIDAGSYTVYAVSSPVNRDSLGGTQYATTSVVTRRPFVTANVSTATVAKGDTLSVTGTAAGDPAQGVAVWVFGTNYYSRASQAVDDDATFAYELGRGTTQALASGQYYAIVQHPMTNGVFDVDEVVETGVTRVYDTSGNFFVAAGPGRLQGSAAATALVNLLNGAYIDDTYTSLTFAVEDARIALSVADVRPGDELRIEGTTNLAPGNTLLVTVISTAFEPTDKSKASGTSGLSGQAVVQAGAGGQNTFNFTAGTAGLAEDTYQVTVESPDARASQTATFRVTAAAGGNVTPTATPAGNVTGNVTPPTTPTGNATATPTAAPGFGALVALAGLAGVALLAARRRE